MLHKSQSGNASFKRWDRLRYFTLCSQTAHNWRFQWTELRSSWISAKDFTSHLGVCNLCYCSVRNVLANSGRLNEKIWLWSCSFRLIHSAYLAVQKKSIQGLATLRCRRVLGPDPSSVKKKPRTCTKTHAVYESFVAHQHWVALQKRNGDFLWNKNLKRCNPEEEKMARLPCEENRLQAMC